MLGCWFDARLPPLQSRQAGQQALDAEADECDDDFGVVVFGGAGDDDAFAEDAVLHVFAGGVEGRSRGRPAGRPYGTG